MAGRVPATHALAVVQRQRWCHRPGVGGRDTPGHDGEPTMTVFGHDGELATTVFGHDGLAQVLLPRPLILMPMATTGHNNMAPPVR